MKNGEQKAISVMKEICHRYSLEMPTIIETKDKTIWAQVKPHINTMYIKNKLYKQDEWKVIEVIGHEMAHIITYHESPGCGHGRKFQANETKVLRDYNIKPIYDRSVGYAVAYIDTINNKSLYVKRGYVYNETISRLEVDTEFEYNNKLTRNIIKEALNNNMFKDGFKAKFMECIIDKNETVLNNHKGELIGKVSCYTNKIDKIRVFNIQYKKGKLSYNLSEK